MRNPLHVVDNLLRESFKTVLRLACEAEEDPRPEAERVSMVSLALKQSYVEEMIWYYVLCAEMFKQHKYPLHKSLCSLDIHKVVQHMGSPDGCLLHGNHNYHQHPNAMHELDWSV